MKDLVKQGIICPNSIDLLVHQLQNIWGASCFFFGNNSILARRIMPTIESITENVLTFEHSQIRDTQFASKLCYAVDTRIFRWLQQCLRKNDRESVDDSLIDFKPMFASVLTDSFYQELPLAISELPSSNNADTENVNNRKRKRVLDDQEERRVTNPKTNPDWMLKENESYSELVSSKHVDKRPILNGKRMCPRYHMKGYCFTNCANKNSHIPSKDVDKNTAKAFFEFVRLCHA